MPKMTKPQLTTAKREAEIKRFMEWLISEGEEAMRAGGNAITYPAVDADGNELYVKVTISIPRGGRDGEAYNGHDAAEDYKVHLAQVAAEREKRERENAERSAKAKERREAAQAKKEAEAAKRAKFLAEQGGE